LPPPGAQLIDPLNSHYPILKKGVTQQNVKKTTKQNSVANHTKQHLVQLHRHRLVDKFQVYAPHNMYYQKAFARQQCHPWWRTSCSTSVTTGFQYHPKVVAFSQAFAPILYNCSPNLLVAQTAPRIPQDAELDQPLTGAPRLIEKVAKTPTDERLNTKGLIAIPVTKSPTY
jgi:hypothetical protein